MKKIFTIITVVAFLTIYFSHFIATLYFQSSVYSEPKKIPKVKTALVLGAGLRPDSSPSDILYDRLETAANLYKTKKIRKIIVSGDNRFKNYNEPDAMKTNLMSMGISEKDIQVDYAGRRTYDSCWRAKNIFSQDDVIVITQSFHMTRSLFLCNQLGIKSIGLIADKPRYSIFSWTYWTIRDIISFSLGIIDIYIRKPPVIRGEKINIY